MHKYHEIYIQIAIIFEKSYKNNQKSLNLDVKLIFLK